MPSPPSFAERALTWFDHAGRKDLPWQHDTSAYRVWVSEIMLQQTQVKTVIPYFQRFMAAFPSVEALASAPLDQVLHLWTGLGYYARARNLHRAANSVCMQFAGQFPNTVDGLCELPGIGRSTAGAIVSIAGGQRAVILDGNVKRVLARHSAVPGWPGKSAIHQQLWAIAEQHTPAQRSGDYSQAMMDLGATLCTRTAPDCAICPVASDCRARAQGDQLDYPGKKPRKSMPVKSTALLMVRAANGDIWLERRAASGIWGGLWCFPEISTLDETDNWCMDRWGLAPDSVEVWDDFRHTFSHYHLDIQPVQVNLASTPAGIMEGADQLWYNSRRPPEIGLAAPVAKLLAQLANRRLSVE